MHPGVPTYDQRGPEVSWLRKFWTRYAWQAFLGLLLPESILLRAIMDYIIARKTLTRLDKLEGRYINLSFCRLAFLRFAS